ncbi:WcbI family polysaccharide biosynthesis putative acetyltransferase [Naumannella halotolerans]|uniref:Polysaccharide biosynthesis enzyme WcbI domain-containing protein n=1 Tax=Naumannella halotolerans TaxID=993414 RepID=A0A4R7J881_9ACTN|nr:WcbI family polysaccharide biosynthesis putative acetyltransferase [Naumannella halotolerans]TDT33692.1 hypothetical protein CLV29_1319 [Naumannella halotolerans]
MSQQQRTAATSEDSGRRRHYGTFYGLSEIPDSGLPVTVVLGNCLAESLRVCLDSHRHVPDLQTVRIPPVHELTAADLPYLQRLLARTDVLLAQPVRENYRELPLGTDQVRQLLPAGAQVVLFPTVRDNTAHPFQVLVRAPGLAEPDIPYQDLRLIAEVAGISGGPHELGAAEFAAALRQISTDSITTMRDRAAAQQTIEIHDVVAARPGQFWTLNHPDNGLVRALAERVRARLGLDTEVTDPGRVLLGSVRAPVDAEVVQALGLDREPSAEWLIDNQRVPDDRVRREHRTFWDSHPEVIEEALEQHADRLQLLGWRLSG